MIENLKECYDLLCEIRKYLIKKGQSRYKGQTIEIKLKESNTIYEKCRTLILVLETSSDIKVAQLGKDIFVRCQQLYDEINNLCIFPTSKETNKMEFDLKVACNLIPVMDDTENTTKRMVDSIEMYASMLDDKGKSLLIVFVLKNRLSENAKLRISDEYKTVSELIRDIRTNLITKKSYTAIQARLQAMRQGQKTIEEYGKEIEQLFTDMTISQADGDSSAFSVLKAVNEKSAIKTFSDGLRSTRVSTIVTARNYSSLKEAIQAAKDEDRPAVQQQGNVMHVSKQGRTFYSSRPFNGSRGRGGSCNYGQNTNYYRGQPGRNINYGYQGRGNNNNYRGKYFNNNSRVNYNNRRHSYGFQRGRGRISTNYKSNTQNRNVYAVEPNIEQPQSSEQSGNSPMQFFRS